MPFKIVKEDNKYRLYNLEKQQFTKKSFNTRKAALNMKKTYMNYDKNKNNKKK
jgi:hypothetical protein